jgi:hypothetical protein
MKRDWPQRATGKRRRSSSVVRRPGRTRAGPIKIGCQSWNPETRAFHAVYVLTPKGRAATDAEMAAAYREAMRR